MMADNPAPLSLSVTRTPAAIDADGDEFAADRDDDADDWPADYAVDELRAHRDAARSRTAARR